MPPRARIVALLAVLFAALLGASGARAAGPIGAPPKIVAGELATVTVEPDPVSEEEAIDVAYRFGGESMCPAEFPADGPPGGPWTSMFTFRYAVRSQSATIRPTDEQVGERVLFCSYQGHRGNLLETFLTGQATSLVVEKPAPAKPKPPPHHAQSTAPRPCGQIPKGSVYSVTASPAVACPKARKIIKRYVFEGIKHPLGYACRGGRQGQYGYVITCRRGPQRVLGTTGI